MSYAIVGQHLIGIIDGMKNGSAVETTDIVVEELEKTIRA